MKTFVSTGSCNPKNNYMVNIDRQVGVAVRMVDEGKYFCINRGRQYGKTTTLFTLSQKLKNEGYAVFNLSFEKVSGEVFASANSIFAEVLYQMKDCYLHNEANCSEYIGRILSENVDIDTETVSSRKMEVVIESLSKEEGKGIVLIIDEVDQASNYEGFIKFLGFLRDLFLKRDSRPTFKSVILASVYDIKNLKLKMRPEGQHLYNSPWNIADSFDVDMSLPIEGIAEMLVEYKSDHGIDFDERAIAQMLLDYTSGYPYLVSRLCQLVDQEQYGWNKEGVLKAVNVLLKERNTLFDDIFKKLNEFPELWELFKDILFSGKRIAYSIDDESIQIATMFSFVKEEHGALVIYCRLMETRIYNAMMLKFRNDFTDYGERNKPKFIVDGMLNMRLILEKFVQHFNEIYTDSDTKFLEREGRKQFLLYLRPIINGVGNYYVEAETRDQTRADVVVDYLGHRYVVELKIWHGERYNEEGEQQLRQYLNYFQVEKGYLVSFNFNQSKQPGVHEVSVGDKQIVEAIV